MDDLKFYPFRAQKANPIIDANSAEHELTILAQLFNSGDAENQKRAFEAVNISFEDSEDNSIMVHMVFNASGKAYAAPTEDRTKLNKNVSMKTFKVNLKTNVIAKSSANLFPVNMRILLNEPYIQDGVNFLGCIVINAPPSNITVVNQDNFPRRIPLYGRGSLALEGQNNDALATFAVSPEAATFQQRCAIVLAGGMALGIAAKHLSVLRDNLANLDANFVGRKDILDYTYDRVIGSPDAHQLSYREYLLARYANSEKSLPVLEAMQAVGDPPEAFYDSVKKYLTDDELRGEIPWYKEWSKQQARLVIQNQLYPIRPRSDVPTFQHRVTGARTSFIQLSRLINQKRKEAWEEALKYLGFNINEDNHTIDLKLKESGRAYSASQDNRKEITANSISESFSGRFTYPEQLNVWNELANGIRIDNLGFFFEQRINFVGKLVVNTPIPAGTSKFKMAFMKKERIIPITGRGTVALEGRSNDAHAGFCTGKDCAAFQTRVALTFAVLARLQVDKEEIDKLHKYFANICKKFHGRWDIYEYTYLATTGQLPKSFASYFEYMKAKYPPQKRGSKKQENEEENDCVVDEDGSFKVGHIPQLLEAFTINKKPFPLYFEKLDGKFQTGELVSEKKWYDREGKRYNSLFGRMFVAARDKVRKGTPQNVAEDDES